MSKLPENHLQLATKYIKLDDEIKKLTKERDVIKEQLKKLGEHEQNGIKVKYRDGREKTDWKAIAQEYNPPETIIKKYTTTGEKIIVLTRTKENNQL